MGEKKVKNIKQEAKKAAAMNIYTNIEPLNKILVGLG